MRASLSLVLALSTIAWPYSWTQETVTNSGFGSLTLTAGGYSGITLYNNKIYGIDLCDAGGGFPHPNIYQNCLWSYNPATGIRALRDTTWWTHEDVANRTYDTTQNLSEPTPPNRHFNLAATTDGKLRVAHGLNNKIKVERAFANTAVNTTTDRITLTSTTPFIHTDEVTFATTGSLPAELTAGTTYYIIYVSATEFKVASSLANARAGTAIDLTTQGSGTDTLKRVVANHPSDTWETDLTTATSDWTQVISPADSMPINSGFTTSWVYDIKRRKFMLIPASDNNGGSSARTYTQDRDSPYAWHRWSQSYQNGDVPLPNSMNGCAYNPRDGVTWCYGGGNSSNPTQQVFKYDTTTETWSQPTWTNKPRARVGHCVEVIPGVDAAHDSLVISQGVPSEGSGTKYTDTFMCSLSSGACDSLPLASVPTAAAWNYCRWVPSQGKLYLRKADNSVNEIWSMPMGVAQSSAPAFHKSLLGVGP